MHENPKTPTETTPEGVKKAREYADRIIDGVETYEDIVAGLGPVMIQAIHDALERRGYDLPNEQPEEVEDVEETADPETVATDPLSEYVAQISDGRKEAVQALYADLLEHKNDPEKRAALTKALIADTYNELRQADYDTPGDEESTWKWAEAQDTVHVHKENGWMYRGTFPTSAEETVARGSFNVDVTPELIAKLDQYIASGSLRANYKFGAPNTPAAPGERHDAISIYFLEEPDAQTLAELAEIIEPYSRGDNLLGKKIANGFYLSEIGSVQSEHIATLIDTLDGIDPAFAQGVREKTEKDGRLAMSEAQFYAIQKTADVFGYNIQYDAERGFIIELNQ